MKTRIAVCKYTRRKVVQIEDQEEPSGWLCLHNETLEEDEVEVKKMENQ